MEKLDEILQSYVANGDDKADKLLGAAFIVANKDKILYRGAAGHVDLAASSAKFSPDTFTWIASMTKIVSVTAIMSVVEKGLVKLDDDMRLVLPDLAKIQILKGFDEEDRPILVDNTKPITLRHLLTHGAGMGVDMADPDLQKWSKFIGRKAQCIDFTREGFTVPLRFPPGEGWYYGGATDWAGFAAEAITGVRLDDWIQQEVFTPLGMVDSTFRREILEEKVKGRTAACAMRDDETGNLTTIPNPAPAEPEVISGGAGLYTTAADYIKVLQSLLRSLSGDGIGLLKQQTVQEMLRPQLADPQRAVLKMVTDMFRVAMVPEFGEGMPLDHGISGIINLEDEPGKRRKGSMMWQGMCNSHWWLDPETGIAATLFVNVQPLPDAVVIQLYDKLERVVYADLLPEVGSSGF